MTQIPPESAPGLQRPPFERWRRGRSPIGWTFQQLLGPVSVKAFARNYWSNHPLVVRGNATFFGSLITLDEIEAMLGIPRVLEDGMVSLRAAHDQVSLPPESVGQIYRRLGEGASLQFRKMERFLPPATPLARLYRDMQLTLQHPGVSVSCFVTPANTELLGVHYDETDIFTLQISGHKRWRFYSRIVPSRRGAFDGLLGQPIEDVLLGPGDLLYHPRGQVHEVTCEDELSCSVLIVFGPLTWKELLHQLVDRLGGRPEIAEALPVGALLGDDAGKLLANGIAARVALIAAEAARLDPEELASAGAKRLLEGLGAEPGPHVVGALEVKTIDPLTQLLPRSGRAYHVSVEGDRAVLILGGGDVLKVPATVAPALRAIMARSDPVAAGSLHEILSVSASLVLARRLVEFGALSRVELDGSAAL